MDVNNSDMDSASTSASKATKTKDMNAQDRKAEKKEGSSTGKNGG
jgi:hypothetical protein